MGAYAAGMLSIELVGGSTEAILALPPEGCGPGVLFVMDAFGLRPRIQEMAERIAGWGYVVLAPNVFHADGTVAELAAPAGEQPRWEDVAPRVARLSGAAVASDIDGYVAALRALPEVGDGPLGAVGFCMGGRIAVRAASRHPEEIAACAAFHTGGLVTEEADSPHRGLAGARAEFLFAHADNDPSMTPAQVEALGATLASAGLVATNVVVPGAAHGYTMSDTPAWNEAAYEWAFEQLRDLLDRTLR